MYLWNPESGRTLYEWRIWIYDPGLDVWNQHSYRRVAEQWLIYIDHDEAGETQWRPFRGDGYPPGLAVHLRRQCWS